MELENTPEMLCIRGRDRNYAFEYHYIKEICPETGISKIPCLPECFSGVCNYKGTIVPVIHTGDMTGRASGRQVVIICQYRDYQLGIEHWGEPYILSTENCRQIRRTDTVSAIEIWIEKEILQAGEELYTVVDLEETIRNLARFFQEEYLRFKH